MFYLSVTKSHGHISEPVFECQRDLHAAIDLETNVMEPWLMYRQKGDCRPHHMVGAFTSHISGPDTATFSLCNVTGLPHFLSHMPPALSGVRDCLRMALHFFFFS